LIPCSGTIETRTLPDTGLSVYLVRGKDRTGPHQFIKSTKNGKRGCHRFEERAVRGRGNGALSERRIVKVRRKKLGVQ
jgi:hypothetical protein